MDLPIVQHVAGVPEVLRDRRGVVVGRLEKQAQTGKVIARDAHGIIVGSYDLREGTTRDAYGKIIARGDVLAALLFAR